MKIIRRDHGIGIPARVGSTGTALDDTLEGSIRIVMDSQPGQRWAETILAEPLDIKRLDS